MPNFALYPSAVDVRVLLQSAGDWPAGADSDPAVLRAIEQATIGAAAAKDEWETVTGWLPYLAGSTPTTRRFRTIGPDGLLQFNAGLLSLSSLTINDVAKTLNTDFVYYPENAAESGLPYTALEFSYGSAYGSWASTGFYGAGRPGQIVVTGIWGKVEILPAAAWEAIQKRGAQKTLAALRQLQSQASLSMDGYSVSRDIVGIQTQKDRANDWGKDFVTIANRQRRVFC